VTFIGHAISGMRGALLVIVLCLMPSASWAALSAVDQETQAMERLVADDPRAALREGESRFAQGEKSADAAAQLKALRLMTLAYSALEDAVKLAELSEQGLKRARALKDAQAECEFLGAKATSIGSSGKYIDAQAMFDEAIQVAEKAGLKRCATGIMISKAFNYGLLGRDSDSLELLFKAHQRYVELGDAISARGALGAIGNAYNHDRSSREDLLKALSYHEQSIAPDAEKNSRHELAVIYFNTGVVQQKLKDWPRAKINYQKSMTLFRALGDVNGEAFVNYRLGVVAGATGRWDEALAFLDKALPALTASGDMTMMFNVQRNRARAFAYLDRRRESLDTLAKTDALRTKIDSSWVEVTYLADVSEIYARLGDHEKAWRNQVLLREAEMRNFNEIKEKDAAEVQTRFEVKQKEAENALLRAREMESEARRAAMLLSIVLLLFVLGGLGWFLLRQGQQNRRFANLALRDDLTGLPNRRSIVEYARVQLGAARMDGSKLCLALIDVDEFKSINDECGHAVGDAVLAAIAAVCAQQLRSNDRLGRYGGEEFLLIMPGSDLTQVPQVFTRLRSAVQQLQVAGLPAARKLTFSMGASQVSGPADDLDKLTKRADDALYRAKQGGRDRYELG